MRRIDTFEQPLNERYRLFLRMEQLFERIEHHLAGDSAWDTHAVLGTMLDLLQTLSRGDSRQEIIRELERQRAALTRFESDSAVDGDRLRLVLAEQDERLEALHRQQGTLGQELRENALLSQLQQRAGPGGRPSAVEIPGYQEWVQRPAEERRSTLLSWLAPLNAAHAAVKQCLELTRESAEWQSVTAEGGYYEQPLIAGQQLQMLRIRLETGSRGIFPEISAGRQRFSIRFFQHEEPDTRSTQLLATTRFTLACCGV